MRLNDKIAIVTGAAHGIGRSIAEVFDEVERGRAEYGVVPVENSTEGAVNVTLDRLIEADYFAVKCGFECLCHGRLRR